MCCESKSTSSSPPRASRAPKAPKAPRAPKAASPSPSRPQKAGPYTRLVTLFSRALDILPQEIDTSAPEAKKLLQKMEFALTKLIGVEDYWLADYNKKIFDGEKVLSLDNPEMLAKFCET